MLNYKSYDNLLKDIKKNIYKLPTDAELIVGIPRSGMIPAYMIGLAMNKKVCSLPEFCMGNEGNGGNRPLQENRGGKLKVLVVDDSISSGQALLKAKKALEEVDSNKYEFKFMAVYAAPEAVFLPDYYLEVLSHPRMFQWNYMNHPYHSKAAFDIDGVLCVDPTEEENDDGENYVRFLKNARALYIPKFKISALITSRLEKYRKYTEVWLHNNGVMYDKLYMLDLPSKEERIRRNAYASFKSEVYEGLKDCSLFYESNRLQAIEIAKKTGKLVFCVETDELFGVNNFEISEPVPAKNSRIKYVFLKMVVKIFCCFIPIKRWRKGLRSLYK